MERLIPTILEVRILICYERNQIAPHARAIPIILREVIVSPKKILAKNREALEASTAIIVVLSDSRGIYLEAGYAKGLGKKVIGLKVEETRSLGLISRNFFDYVVDNIDELSILLKDLEKEE